MGSHEEINSPGLVVLTVCSSIPSEFSAMIVILVQFTVYGILMLPLLSSLSLAMIDDNDELRSLHVFLTTILYLMLVQLYAC